jgi:hypothetical protein
MKLDSLLQIEVILKKGELILLNLNATNEKIALTFR